jgi:DNA repair protein RadC
MTDVELLWELINNNEDIGYSYIPQDVVEHWLNEPGDLFNTVVKPSISIEMELGPHCQRLKMLGELYKRLAKEAEELAGKRPQIITSTQDVVGHVLPIIEAAPHQEHVIVFDLYIDNTLIQVREVFTGTANAITLDMKTLLRDSVICNADKIVVVHNHPSGSLTPSEADIGTMASIKRAAKLLDIIVADMVIAVRDGRVRSILSSIPG